MPGLVKARHNLVDCFLSVFHELASLVTVRLRLLFILLQLLALDPNLLILFFDVDDHLNKFSLLLLHLRCLLSELLVVGFNLSNRLLDLVQSFVVPLLNLDHILLALLKKPCKDAECAHEEYRGNVDHMSELFVIDLAKLDGLLVHQTDRSEYFRVQIFLSLLVVLVLFLRYFGVTWAHVNFSIVLFDEDFLADLL